MKFIYYKNVKRLQIYSICLKNKNSTLKISLQQVFTLFVFLNCRYWLCVLFLKTEQ